MKAIMSLRQGRFIVIDGTEFKVSKEVMRNLLNLKLIDEIKYEVEHK